jgi:DNA-binding GntR family transcriptional regulator
MKYEFRPGDRINEQALGREFGVSRGPLREALNRLVAEGFFDFVLNKGFFRKAVSAEEVFNLYQVRIALERRALFLAVPRASETQIVAVGSYWNEVLNQTKTLSSNELLLADEEFHRRLVALSGNRELGEFLEVVTRRLHVARRIDIENSDWNQRTFRAHVEIVDACKRRDMDATLRLITDHIAMSLKRAVEITKEMVAQVYLGSQPSGTIEEEELDRDSARG